MSYPNHVFLVIVRGRSHAKLFTSFGFNVLRAHPSTCVTFFSGYSDTSIIEEEVKGHPKQVLDEMKGRYRVITHTPEKKPSTTYEIVNQSSDCFVDFWLNFVIGNQVQVDGAEWFKRIPCLVTCDVMACKSLTKIREINEAKGIKGVTTIALIPSVAIIAHRIFGKYEEGGYGQGLLERYRTYRQKGDSDPDAARRAIGEVHHKLLEFPDLPPMYDYEFSPQSDSRDYNEFLITLMDNVVQGWKEQKTLIYLSAPELEMDSLKGHEQAGVKAIGLGPQLSQSLWSGQPNEPETSSEVDTRIFKFLDKAKQDYGDHTAAFISLGSVTWPSNRLDKLEIIIHSLLELEKPVPFIFTTPVGKLSDDLKSKVEESGRGMIVDWAPQVRILQHPATGMFLSHCGNGSMSESIVTGVPIIALPFFGDQINLAAFYIRKYHCGYELHELTSGLQGLPLGNGYIVTGTRESAMKELKETWMKLRGEAGEERRKNVAGMREIWRKSLEEGESRKNLLTLSQFFAEQR